MFCFIFAQSSIFQPTTRHLYQPSVCSVGVTPWYDLLTPVWLQLVYSREGVAVWPTRKQRIPGTASLVKQGAVLFFQWLPSRQAGGELQERDDEHDPDMACCSPVSQGEPSSCRWNIYTNTTSKAIRLSSLVAAATFVADQPQLAAYLPGHAGV
jgi:hypothetical protein